MKIPSLKSGSCYSAFQLFTQRALTSQFACSDQILALWGSAFLSFLFFLPTVLQWTRKVTQMDKALTLREAGLKFIPAACQLTIVNQRRGLREKQHLELHFLCRFQPCALIYYTVWKMYFKSHKPTTEYDLTCSINQSSDGYPLTESPQLQVIFSLSLQQECDIHHGWQR